MYRSGLNVTKGKILLHINGCFMFEVRTNQVPIGDAIQVKGLFNFRLIYQFLNIKKPIFLYRMQKVSRYLRCGCKGTVLHSPDICTKQCDRCCSSSLPSYSQGMGRISCKGSNSFQRTIWSE